MMARASSAAQADVYTKADVHTCCAFNPRDARVEKVNGGWALSGRWQFASGCLHADWALLSAIVEKDDPPILMLVPKGEFAIEDTWHVSGLRGTGSNDIVIAEPLFVPGHRFVPVQVAEGLDPVTCSNGSFAAPQPSITPWAVVMPVIGMAAGALKAYEAATSVRVSAFGGQKISQMVGPQLRISEAASKIDAAHALARSDIQTVIARGISGGAFSIEERVRFRRNHAFVVNLCYDATMMLARSAGAGSLFDDNPIQRFLRDVHAGAMQVASNWDEQAESYGRVRLGLEPNGIMW
jgi:alkylation response protein AidB-like acyl-CoA dehydrogenase